MEKFKNIGERADEYNYHKAVMASGSFNPKFKVKVDGVWKVVYFVLGVPYNVIKVDGERTYLWCHDPRIDGTKTLVYPQAKVHR